MVKFRVRVLQWVKCEAKVRVSQCGAEVGGTFSYLKDAKVGKRQLKTAKVKRKTAKHGRKMNESHAG